MGKAIYEQHIRSAAEGEHDGRIVAIDVESGDYEIADDTLVASRSLLTRRPEAQIWLERVGRRAVHRFGGRRREYP